MVLHVAVRKITSGPAGTVQTLKLMREIIRQGKRNPTVLETARRLTANVAPKAYSDEVRALFFFVRDKIRYVHDIADEETLQTPDVTLSLASGDCDDKVILLASLLEAIGHKTRSVAMKEIATDPEFTHVYLETRIGASWYPLETTEAGWGPGNAPPSAVRLPWYN